LLRGAVEIVESLAAVVVRVGGGQVASHYGDGRDVGSWGFLIFRPGDWTELTAELRGTVTLLVLQGVRDGGSELGSSDAFQRGILNECGFLFVGRIEVAGEFLAVRALATVHFAASLDVTLSLGLVSGTVAGPPGSANRTVKAVVVAEPASSIAIVQRYNKVGRGCEIGRVDGAGSIDVVVVERTA
jgi:hypothetical protein